MPFYSMQSLCQTVTNYDRLLLTQVHKDKELSTILTEILYVHIQAFGLRLYINKNISFIGNFGSLAGVNVSQDVNGGDLESMQLLTTLKIQFPYPS